MSKDEIIMSHSPEMDVNQSLMAKIKDQNENGMHGKISTTIPNRPKSQIKHAVRNNITCTAAQSGYYLMLQGLLPCKIY
jgi:hypothetical protein